MKDFKRPALFLIFCAVLVSSLSLLTVRAQTTATISTDQKFYSVGQGMVISGKGFSPSAQITVSVERPDHQTDYLSLVVSDASGGFTTNYAPPQEPGRYNITATDGVNTATLAKTEADAIGYNKAAYNKGDTTYTGGSASKWTTGEIKNYLEGQWTFYQYEVTGAGTTVPDFDVYYDESNSAGVFIDGLANFRACLDCTDHSDASGLLSDGQFAPPITTTNWVDAHTAISHINQQYVGTTCGGADALNTPAANNCFSVNGATLQSLLTAAWISAHGGTNPFATGTHTVTLYYAAHLARTTVWSSGKEYLLGCSSDANHYIIASGPNGLQGAEFVPHSVFGTDAYNPGSYGVNQYTEQASACPTAPPPAGDWTTTAFIGAGSDNGASYHFNLNSAVGSQGNLALPIPNVAAPTGSITIVKVTNPSVAANTSFTFGSDFGGTFNLDTDPATQTPSTVTFSNLDGGAVYNVNENSLPSGWTNTTLLCTGSGSTFTYGGDATNGRSAAITLSSTSGASVTCTFTNTGGGHIIVNKHITPASATFAHFPFTTTGTGYTGFSLTGGGTNTDGGSAPAGGLAPGIYTISEGSPITAEGGTFWVLNDRTCTSASGASTVPTNHTVGQPASITLAAGDTVTCDYYNVWPDGNVTIDPLTPKNEVNSAETFTITVNAVPDNPTGTVLFTGAGLGITPSVTSSPQPDLGTSTTCGSPTITTGVNLVTATCTYTINSSVAGTFTVHVHAVFSVDGVTLTRDTGATAVSAISPNAGPAAPGANSVDAVKTYIAPATTLTTKSAPTSLEAGATATVVVTETNTGTGPITGVNVTGGGKCTTFTGGATTLAAGASTDFTCTFTVVAGANAWSADGHGTDELNNAVPATGEHTEGSVNGVNASTTLTTKSAPTNLEAGATATIVVTETNTGTGPLTGVNVTGGGKCTTFTGGATTLAAGASTDFTCTFTVTAGANAWSADGHGTDELNNAVSADGEHTEGSVHGVTASTTLTTKSAPTNLEAGTTATVVVTETNTGNGTLTGVNVTGGGKCTTFTGGATTLAAGASTDFTCTFTVTAGANAWSADGHGTDELNNAVPADGEHTEGSVNGVAAATSLTLKSSPSSLVVGSTATIVVTETNTGNSALTGVNVTGGGSCATFTGGATTLAVGAATDFTCTFTVVAGANAWSADGHGTDSLGNAAPAANEHQAGSVTGLVLPTLTILKSTHGVTDTFGWTVTGANPLTPSASVPANSTNFQVFTGTINVGTNVISENPPNAGWTLTDVSCTGYTGANGDGAGTLDNNGVPTNWTFTASYGDHVVCSYVNSNIQTTRTQGFWATHTTLASHVWSGLNVDLTLLPGYTPLGADNTLCGVTIGATLGTAEENELMGGFWANVAKTSTGGKRSAIDQARMQMLQQYLAAVLNVHAFGSGSEAMLTTAQNAYCGTDLTAIKAQVGILGTFNQSGDSGTFTPGASATAPESKKEADIDFWDTPRTPSEPQP